MAPSQKQMKLGAFLMKSGHHVAGWRHPDARADAGVSFDHYAGLARTAEQAKLDLLFISDSNAVRGPGLGSIRHTWRTDFFEPFTLVAALSSITSRIGLVVTASTTFNEPFHIARKFASLDHLSKGRSGWNLVTSSNPAEALNFSGDDLPLHADRYERAHEFADVVRGLWDSWEEDAFLRDKASGSYVDPEKMHVLNHRGKHFRVQGPLTVARPPQGHPVIFQAGSSEAGKELAAATADIVFTAQQSLKEAQAFYADVKGRLGKYGRAPDDLKIMPGIFPIVGRTEQEAIEKFQQLQDLILPEVGVGQLWDILGGVDLSNYPVDGPVPRDVAETNNNKSRQKMLLDLAYRENMSIRKLYQHSAGGGGHWRVIGTAAQIADQMEERFRSEAADGFNILPATLPGEFNDFVELVIPELRRRGIFRSEYEGQTLRDNLGLPHRTSLPKAAGVA